MFCNFISIDNYTYQCSRCGIKVSSSDGLPPTLPCSLNGLLNSKDEVVVQLKDFAKESLSDAAVLAQDYIIENRYRICETCEFFDKGSCSKCGCIISRTKNYINKLTLADSKCPMARW